MEDLAARHTADRAEQERLRAEAVAAERTSARLAANEALDRMRQQSACSGGAAVVVAGTLRPGPFQLRTLWMVLCLRSKGGLRASLQNGPHQTGASRVTAECELPPVAIRTRICPRFEAHRSGLVTRSAARMALAFTGNLLRAALVAWRTYAARRGGCDGRRAKCDLREGIICAQQSATRACGCLWHPDWVARGAENPLPCTETLEAQR